ncbi:Lsr2 family DNA-binding protein [Streptomyces sp. CA-111067]|uniref:Lsr2 family DNA-binding protein n=1 Tax=Streptomyces sp. CA-111067 TaxID=3240046 RepID=UPI003D9797B8
MTTTTAPAADPAAMAVALLQANTPAHEIAAETGLSIGQVIAAAEEAGLTRKPDQLAVARELVDALEWARTHSDPKVHTLADKAKAAFNELAARRAAEAVIVRTQKEITDLEQRLAAAQNKLRKARGDAPIRRRASNTTTASLTREQRTEIRTWARANGHTVGDAGVIPATVVQAWQNAHRA